ncbi:MAG: DNA polymerase III subunit gamma/tau [Saprospiraceae bacterium]
MSNFVVSARKYRPIRFDDVVGQSHVSQTLKNALQNDHLAHAFLFCGPRGVGKTTCARILAKVLNCQNLTPEYEACDTCSSCKAFNENASFNITELDAASNNSVEHIRALIEQVRFQPQQGKYKVFIIDEVHMLSQQAFNAFLKTLEEPPPYAIFILATTEKHKIIPTILSRCQIFDFRRIQVPDMVQHLQVICTQEQIAAEQEALHIIAQKADGALRDALSIFDRIVSFSGKKISYQDVIENLNVLDYDYFFKFTDALLVEDISKVLLTFDEILKKGFDADIFINGLAEHFRNLLVCQEASTIALLELSDSLKERYLLQAQIAVPSFILTALNLANTCDIDYKMARNKRLHVEMALIKMAYINRAVHLSKVGIPAMEKKTLDTTEELNPSPSTSPIVMAKKEDKTTTPPVPVIAEEKAVTTPTKAVTTEVKEEAPKAGYQGNTKFDTPKLMNLDRLALEVDKDAAAEQQGGAVLTAEETKVAWLKYAEGITSPSVRGVLQKAMIEIKEDTIVVTIGSKLAKSSIQQELDLMPFMRKALGKHKLALEVNIDASKTPVVVAPVKKKLLTPKEQYEKLREINPLIDTLKERFDLGPTNG